MTTLHPPPDQPPTTAGRRPALMIGGWRPMSPDRVRQQQFPETPIGRRGYRPGEVHAFVHRLADEIDRWIAAHAAERAENQRLRRYFRSDAVREEVISSEAVTVLATAQQQADRLLADAQAHARQMQTDARAQAEDLLAAARRQVDAAAHAYRAHAGPAYSPDREQVARLTAFADSILAAVTGATTQLDGASAQLGGASTQLRALAAAFSTELAKIAGSAAPTADAPRGSSFAPPGRHEAGAVRR